jgi:hypothetical protein
MEPVGPRASASRTRWTRRFSESNKLSPSISEIAEGAPLWAL